MSRQAGSIVRGFQSRAGYPRMRASSRWRLCTAGRPKGQGSGNRPFELAGIQQVTATRRLFRDRGRSMELVVRSDPQNLLAQADVGEPGAFGPRTRPTATRRQVHAGIGVADAADVEVQPFAL